MYYKYNDYELLYLMREGVELAQSIFFKKYQFLIGKMFKENECRKKWNQSDFCQEGLMLLNTLTQSYSQDFLISFHSFFKVCLKRRMQRLERNGTMYVKEKHTDYIGTDLYKDPKSFSVKQYVLEKEMLGSTPLLQELFRFCFIEQGSVRAFSRLHQEDYGKMYYEYKKIKAKILKKVD